MILPIHGNHTNLRTGMQINLYGSLSMNFIIYVCVILVNGSRGTFHNCGRGQCFYLQNQQAAGQQGGAPGGNPGNAGNAGAGGQGPGGPSGAGQSNVMNPAASMPTSQPTSQV